jgi:hypothetical protein
MVGQRHDRAALPPGKTRYPLYRWLGGPRDRSGRVWKISPPLKFDPGTVETIAIRSTDWAILAYAPSSTQINNVFQLWIHLAVRIYVVMLNWVAVRLSDFRCDLLLEACCCVRCGLLVAQSCWRKNPHSETYSFSVHSNGWCVWNLEFCFFKWPLRILLLQKIYEKPLKILLTNQWTGIQVLQSKVRCHWRLFLESPQSFSHQRTTNLPFEDQFGYWVHILGPVLQVK